MDPQPWIFTISQCEYNLAARQRAGAARLDFDGLFRPQDCPSEGGQEPKQRPTSGEAKDGRNRKGRCELGAPIVRPPRRSFFGCTGCILGAARKRKNPPHMDYTAYRQQGNRL